MKYDYSLEVIYCFRGRNTVKKSKCKSIEGCRHSANSRIKNQFSGKYVSSYRIIDSRGNIVEKKSFSSDDFQPKYIIARVTYYDPFGNSFEKVHEYFCATEENYNKTLKTLESCTIANILSK